MADEYFYGKFQPPTTHTYASRTYFVDMPRADETADCFSSRRLRAIVATRVWPAIIFSVAALTLKGKQSSEVWDPEAKGDSDFQGGHKLIIKQAVLGPEATEGKCLCETPLARVIFG